MVVTFLLGLRRQQLLNDTRSALLVYGVGLILVLLSCCGLILDLGSFEVTRIQMQNAADAAAMGAAVAVQNGGLASAGLMEASQNGFTNGANGVGVTMITPPLSGAYINSTYSIQSIITKPVTGMFLRTTFTLRVQATAFAFPTPCVYFLNRSTSVTTLLAINETIATTCPFYLGRNYNFNGGSSSSGGQFFVSSASTNSSGYISPTPAFGAPSMADPLSYLAPPNTGACTYTNYTVAAKTTLLPGTYCGGLAINTSSTVTLTAGTYIILGSLSINGPTLKGTGVTFYISQANGYLAGPSSIQNVNSTLSAPTAGTMQGILYYSDRALSANQANLTMQNWNPGSITDGIFYLPGQELILSNLTLQPNAYLGFVADFVSVNNTGLHPSANYTSLANGNPFHPTGGGAGLVE